MENKRNFNNSKAIIAYLAEKFPRCFSITSAVAPLKIGIFQELIACMPDEVHITKSQLRLALRQYTASWRYLNAIKPGKQRVDLQGEPCGELTTQHVEYACKKLAASKLRAQKRHQAQQASDSATLKSEKNRLEQSNKARKSLFNSKESPVNEARPSKTTVTLNPMLLAATEPITLKLGQGVQVRLGRKLQSGTIIGIDKSSVRVQFASGLALVVSTQYVQF